MEKKDMAQDLPAYIPEGAWLRAAGTGRRLLMLDYDGTLAPFHSDPRRARPLSASVSLLRSISAGGATEVAIISGRPISELEIFLAELDGVRLVGESGWEVKEPRGELVRHPLSAPQRRALERAAAAAGTQPWGWRVERKRTSLRLHTRGVPSGEAADIERACFDLWAQESGASDLRLRSRQGGVELTAGGRDKGSVVADMISATPAETFSVYVGNDETDEAAFRIVARHGFGIRVGDPLERSSALGAIRSWFDVPIFLKEWLAIVESRRFPGGEVA